MLSNDIGNELVEYMNGLNDMEQKKAEELKQADLENIKFDIVLNKEMFKYNYVLVAMAIALSLKMMAKATYMNTFDDAPMLLLVLKVIMCICIVYAVVYCVFYPIIMERFFPLSIKGRVLCYKDKVYDANQITMVKVSALQKISVYIGRKKLFSISKQFLNRESFLTWARKSGVTVFHEPSVDINKVIAIMLVIIVVVILFVVSLFIFNI